MIRLLCRVKTEIVLPVLRMVLAWLWERSGPPHSHTGPHWIVSLVQLPLMLHPFTSEPSPQDHGRYLFRCIRAKSQYRKEVTVIKLQTLAFGIHCLLLLWWSTFCFFLLPSGYEWLEGSHPTALSNVSRHCVGGARFRQYPWSKKKVKPINIFVFFLIWITLCIV